MDQARRLKELEKENNRLKRLVADLSLVKQIHQRCCGGILLSPERRRQAVSKIRDEYGMSERRICRLLDHPRGTQRYVFQVSPDEDELTKSIPILAKNYGRYCYRRITALLQASGGTALKIPATRSVAGRAA